MLVSNKIVEKKPYNKNNILKKYGLTIEYSIKIFFRILKCKIILPKKKYFFHFFFRSLTKLMFW